MTHFHAPQFGHRQGANHRDIHPAPVSSFSLRHTAICPESIAVPPCIQPKLTIGSAGDRDEQEADRMAAEVVQQINTAQFPDHKPQLSQISSPAPLQRKQAGAIAASSSRMEAAIEQAGSGQALPAAIRHPMERAFGADFSGVKIHADSQSDALNRSIQARAFTTRQNIFFRQGNYNPNSQSGQTLLAHELTHVVQQSKQPSNTPTIQRYSEVKVDGEDYRAADDRSMYVRQNSIYGSHELWASLGKGEAASKMLEATGSVLRLVEKKRRDFLGADGITRTMALISPQNVANKTAGTRSATGMQLWADCGKSARDIIGTGLGTGGGDPKAAYNLPGGKKAETAGSANPTQLKEEVMLAYVLYREKKTGKELINKTLLGRLTGRDRTALIFQHYNGLTDKGREAIDKEVGMNRWADPNVGEGFTISTGGATKPGKRNWNFHWAGVVMKSNKGTDYVTLENYAVGDASVENRKWDYQMYGSAKAAKADPTKLGQTFHEQHRDEHGQHGTMPTTLRVRR